MSVTGDVKELISGPNISSDAYVKSALSDLYRLLELTQKTCGKDKAIKSTFLKAKRKIIFYLSWCQEKTLKNFVSRLQKIWEINKLEVEAMKMEEIHQ